MKRKKKKVGRPAAVKTKAAAKPVKAAGKRKKKKMHIEISASDLQNQMSHAVLMDVATSLKLIASQLSRLTSVAVEIVRSIDAIDKEDGDVVGVSLSADPLAEAPSSQGQF